jgi:hypothetical protein
MGEKKDHTLYLFLSGLSFRRDQRGQNPVDGIPTGLLLPKGADDGHGCISKAVIGSR